MQFSEEVKITDSVHVVLTTDAIIFLNEFRKYYVKIGKASDNYNHFFAAIFLQIYVEYFLHQFMRIITNITPLKQKFANYDSFPLKDKHRKIGSGKISKFIECFSLSDSPQLNATRKRMDCALGKLNRIRNSIVHGHDFSKSFTTNQDEATLSPALDLVKNTSIDQLIENANEIGKCWNQILDQILSKFNKPITEQDGRTWSINEVESFKWEKIEVVKSKIV